VLLELRLDGASPDALGRAAAALGQTLRAGLRPFDVLARPAPERFVALVPEPEREAAALLSDLSRRARQVLADAGIPAELRVGSAVFPDDAVDAAGLEHHAAGVPSGDA
jgi:GGDEF domain-containing protein